MLRRARIYPSRPRTARISSSRLRPANCSIPFKVSIKNGPESATEAPGAHGRLREPEFPPPGLGLQFGDFLLTFLLKTDPKQPRRAHGPPEAPGRPEFPPPGLGLPVGAFLLNLLLKTNPNQPRRQQSTGRPARNPPPRPRAQNRSVHWKLPGPRGANDPPPLPNGGRVDGWINIVFLKHANVIFFNKAKLKMLRNRSCKCIKECL